MRELAAAERRPELGWWPALWEAATAIRAGRLDDGERLALEAHAIGAPAYGEAADVELQAQLFWLRWRQGRLAELDGAAQSLGDTHRGLPIWRAAAVLVDAELDRRELGARRARRPGRGRLRVLPARRQLARDAPR